MVNETLDAIIPGDTREYARQTVLVLDLLGTFVFALSGGVAGVRQRLDLFGVFVVSFAAGSLGGVIRDLLIGSIPPAAIQDWRYAAVALSAGVTVFLWHPAIKKVQGHILILDAAGLALLLLRYAKGPRFWYESAYGAAAGMLTGIGGGHRTRLLVEKCRGCSVRTVRRCRIRWALVIVTGSLLGLPPLPMAIAGASLCFGLRFLALSGVEAPCCQIAN